MTAGLMLDRELRLIGSRLARLRADAGLSLSAVARLLDGRSKQSVHAYETGAAMPPADTLARLAVLYGASADWILFGDGGAGRYSRDAIRLAATLDSLPPERRAAARTLLDALTR